MTTIQNITITKTRSKSLFTNFNTNIQMTCIYTYSNTKGLLKYMF